MSARPGPREGVLVLLGAFVLACAMFWPLPANLSSTIAKDAGDPLLQAWQVAWDGHALIEQPLDFWDANLSYPARDSLAFSDALVGYAPAGLIGSGPEAALVRYNLLFLLVYALCVAGPYVLARELGLARAPAVIAGLAFAYSPWRWEQSGHLHVISSGSIALAVALLLRGYRHGSPVAVVAGWAVVAWQVLIGVSLGLFLLYLVACLAAVGVVLWWRAGRPAPPRSVVMTTGAGLLIVALALAFVAPAYLRVRDAYPTSQRSLATLETLSPPLKSFITAPQANTVWSTITAGNRADLPAIAEQTLFPGATILVLAAIGLATRGYSRRLRIGLLIAALAAFVFSLGLRIEDGRFTYRLLYDHLPGFDGIRTPGRLHTFTTLALALLAASGAQWAAERAARRRPALGRVPVATAACVLLGLAVLVEGSSLRNTTTPERGRFALPDHPEVPLPPPDLADAQPPLLQLPIEASGLYILWSTDGFPKMVNGSPGFEIPEVTRLQQVAPAFPDADSVETLRAAGVRTVVIYPTLSGGTPWADASTRPIDGLGIRRRIGGGVILFDLNGLS